MGYYVCPKIHVIMIPEPLLVYSKIRLVSSKRFP